MLALYSPDHTMPGQPLPHPLLLPPGYPPAPPLALQWRQLVLSFVTAALAVLIAGLFYVLVPRGAGAADDA